jgi:hypothetical protein
MVNSYCRRDEIRSDSTKSLQETYLHAAPASLREKDNITLPPAMTYTRAPAMLDARC